MSREGAIAEYQKMLAEAALAPEHHAERDLVTIEVELESVYDVMSHEEQVEMGVREELITANTDESLELCRAIADYARAKGYSAILSPSAALPGHQNLSIYIDGPAALLNLRAGAHREPLNY